MDTKTFANWVRAAMAAKENSFDRAAYDVAAQKSQEEWDRRKAAGDQTYMYCVTDAKAYYRLNDWEAVESVVPAEWVMPVYLLMVQAWNDIAMWADDALGLAPQKPNGLEAEESPHIPAYAFAVSYKDRDGLAYESRMVSPGRNMLHAAFECGRLCAPGVELVNVAPSERRPVPGEKKHTLKH